MRKRVFTINWDYTVGKDIHARNPNGRGVYIEERIQSGRVLEDKDVSYKIRLSNGKLVTVKKNLVFNNYKSCLKALKRMERGLGDQ